MAPKKSQRGAHLQRLNADHPKVDTKRNRDFGDSDDECDEDFHADPNESSGNDSDERCVGVKLAAARSQAILGCFPSGLLMCPDVLTARAEPHAKTRRQQPVLSDNANRFLCVCAALSRVTAAALLYSLMRRRSVAGSYERRSNVRATNRQSERMLLQESRAKNLRHLPSPAMEAAAFGQ
uniref:Uncharacterized protein n=1 Tax=Haptolina brevifila TaxID=156173 RepID=A0A7S2JJB5_9EUKA|mmetsp:Transcript_83971/g.167601  ORF Transcript_83971/g.167601 Transcript_83971/m.167601 type:complete len:180 (+) Transcript_83971:80-619(+)